MSLLANSIVKLTNGRYATLSVSERFQIARRVYAQAKRDLPSELPLDPAVYERILFSQLGVVSATAHAQGGVRDVLEARVDWEELLAEGGRWQEGVDFADLFGTARLLLIGDTHHGFLGVQRGIVEHVAELKAAGVTHLCLEIPSDLKLTGVDQIATGTWIPHRFKQLVETAQRLGLEVVFMDMPRAKQADYTESERSVQRGVYMGRFLSALLSVNPRAKAAALTGYFHLQDQAQIRRQLESSGHSFCSVAIVSEGQRDYVAGREDPLHALPVVAAIGARVESHKRYGSIDLRGLNFVVDGLIYFPRPNAEAPRAASLGALLFESPAPESTALALSGGARGLAIPDGQLKTPLHISFEDRVEPSSSAWEATNEEKIIEFVGHLEGLTNNQRFYLAAMLFSYARNTGSHSLGGSIISMGFVPAGQFFEITVVDTCMYPYNPKADYGQFLQQREISLQTLQQTCGFPDLFSIEVKGLEHVSISNHSGRPLAIPKIIALALTVVSHPERVRVLHEWIGTDSRLTVFFSDVSGVKSFTGLPVLTELRVRDFSLDEREERVLSASRLLTDRAYGIFSRLALFLPQKYIKAGFRPAWFNPKQKLGNEVAWALISEVGQIILSGPFGDYFTGKVPHFILTARQHLRFLDAAEIQELVQLLGASIARLEQILQKSQRFFSKYGADRETDDRGNGVAHYLAEAQTMIAELKSIEASFQIQDPDRPLLKA